MKITEATIQAVIMRWAISEKHHEFIIPNSNSFLNFSWEADLISVTKSGLCHEYEVKLCRSDYLRDAKKYKHFHLGDHAYSPAYFWYATYNFVIEPPENAGWMNIYYNETRFWWNIDIKKPAPKLNNWKINERKYRDAARLLSWRTVHIFEMLYAKGKPDFIEGEAKEVI